MIEGQNFYISPPLQTQAELEQTYQTILHKAEKLVERRERLMSERQILQFLYIFVFDSRSKATNFGSPSGLVRHVYVILIFSARPIFKYF